jgi:rhodanese-related sulfurtransferase
MQNSLPEEQPTMPLRVITAQEARRLIKNGAAIVDVREADEYARERISGANNVPLSKLAEAEMPAADALIFHCKSGARTTGAAGRLAAKVADTCEAYIVEGGLNALSKAGHPVERVPNQPIEMQRQVQIGAGGLVFVGTILGLLVSPSFFAIPAFVGAGLVFAGVTGFCGMARLLVHAPWNRRASTARA